MAVYLRSPDVRVFGPHRLVRVSDTGDMTSVLNYYAWKCLYETTTLDDFLDVESLTHEKMSAFQSQMDLYKERRQPNPFEVRNMR